MRRISALALLLLVPWRAAAQGEPAEITFLDVGQGDAIVVRSPEGRIALIDAGPGPDVTPALHALGVERLDLVVATHPHADHIGGMRHVLESLPVRYYMDNGEPYTTATYLRLMGTLQRHAEITYLEAVPRTLTLGSLRIRVLPLPPWASTNPNNYSIGLVVEYGDFRGLLSGDSERPELQYFVDSGDVPDLTLLKAPHHGSSDAVSVALLDAARPEVVVVSVGAENTYGHPSPEALAVYPTYADEVYRTDLDGQVTVLGYQDGSYEVRLGQTAVARSRDGFRPTGPETAPPVAPAPPSPPQPLITTVAVTIGVFADAPGNDNRNPNGEYATLSNAADSRVDVSGWTLCDAARHCFTFPGRSQIPAHGMIVLYTGRGVSDGARFFMEYGSAVWNNDGDTATLYDRSGRVAASYAY